MASTYEPIATTTLSSTATSVTFSSISGSYTDLVLVVATKPSSADQMRCQLNSDTGSNYSSTYLYGNGSSAASGRASSMTSSYMGYTNTDWTTYIYNFNNYSNTTTYKTFFGRASDSTLEVGSYVNLWRSTSAISTIYLFLNGTKTFASGSIFTLYGIKAA